MLAVLSNGVAENQGERRMRSDIMLNFALLSFWQLHKRKRYGNNSYTIL